MVSSYGNLQISAQARSNGGVTGAIRQASAKTGVDFDYLVKQARVESSLNPNARARTSSATGLYQFIDQTWLRMVKSYGAEHGYGNYARAISQNSDGSLSVTNRGMKNAILNLRRDPKASSLMAAELATENNKFLKQTVGGEPSGTDLYLAHFMGAQGASNFLNSMKKNPWAPAASLFPEAARANRGVFYENGKPLSLQAIYNRFDAKFQGDSPSKSQALTQAASAASSQSFEETVILPLASDWSNPTNSIAQRRIDRLAGNHMGRTGMLAFASETSTAGVATNTNSLGRMLRAPVDVMFMAQSNGNFDHNDRSRYNA